MKDYVDPNDLGFLAQLKQLKIAAAATGFAAKYGFSATDLQSMVDDWFYFDYVLTNRHLTEGYVHSLTEHKNLLRDGSKTAVLGGFPPQPIFAAVPANVPPEGIEQRFRDRANKIKATAGYNVADGKAMGIEGVFAVVDYTKGKPDPKIELNGGFAEIKVHFHQFKVINIYKNTGGAGYGTTPFKTIHHSPFIDKSPLPALGATRNDCYKLVYDYKDNEVGTFSEEICIAVTGII